MNFLDAATAAEGEQTRQWQSSNFTNEHEKPVTNTTSMLNNTYFSDFFFFLKQSFKYTLIECQTMVALFTLEGL